ncbi:MAG TPA: GDP-mannose 4,6-dehydratase [Vicinamibacterales bacterium]|nr:GDP-mannose 4,6-dehydratase [Vicinamibacterales bacterium]
MTTIRRVPLVTGATGFAGSHLLERLLGSHDQVAGWSNRAARTFDAGARVHWQPVDVLDRQAVRDAIRALEPSVVFHCAGLPHVAESWGHADRALQVNALGTHHLLDGVREYAPDARVVVAGSALVYRQSDQALTEDSPIGPNDPYGLSKLAQEMLAVRAETPVMATRPFNHIGPRQQPSFATSSFAKQIADIEAGRREPVMLVGNLDSRRDLMDVRDTVRAYEALAATGTPGRVYNICSGTAHRVGDVLDRLIGMARVRVTVKQDPARMRPSDNPLVLGDPSRIAADTGWRTEIPLDQTLEDLLAWWRTQVTSG